MRVSRGITQDAEFEELGRRGYTGNLNDRQYKLLGNIGLRGALTDRIGSSGISAYALAAVDDKLPPLVMDMKEEDYFSNNTIGSFSEVVEHSRNGNATMTDSSGNIVWAPHNLLTYSEDLESGGQAYGTGVIASNNFTFTATSDYVRLGGVMTVPTKGKYTGKVTVSGGEVGDTFNIELVDFADGSDSNTTVVTIDGTTKEWVIEADFSGSSTFSGALAFYINRSTVGRSITAGSTITVNYMHVYRSDLGGMADVPADERVIPTATKYVPTTDAARYLPRRGHHVYNGSQWVNKGLFVESESRTNLVTYSNDLTSWTPSNIGVTTNQEAGPSGLVDLDKITPNTSNTYHFVRLTPTSAGALCTFHVVAKAGDYSWLVFGDNLGSSGGNQRVAWFNLSTGLKGSKDDNSTGSITAWDMEPLGGGMYHCWITLTTSSGFFDLGVSNADGVRAFAGDGTSGLYAGYAQLEAASTPSSYIPTNGATVTRPAETITIPAANLPWPNPVYVTGEELVTNGTFDTDTSGWTAYRGATLSVVSQTLDIAGNGVSAGGAASQEITTTANSVYELTFDIVEIQAGTTSRVAIGSGSGDLGSGLSRDIRDEFNTLGVGSHTIVFTAVDAGTYITFSQQDPSTNSVRYDNISVKEINPLALSIQMKGEMTYADTGTFAEVRPFQWVLDGSNFLDVTLSTSGANTGQVWHRQTALGTPDNVTSSATTYSPDINVPFNIASRHGSTFINGAVDGVALTANTTPVALPDLENTDLELAYDFMGTIDTFRVWAEDIGDTGIEEATS